MDLLRKNFEGFAETKDIDELRNLKIDSLSDAQKNDYDTLKLEIGKLVGHDPGEYKAKTIGDFFTEAYYDVLENHGDKIEKFRELFKSKK